VVQILLSIRFLIYTKVKVSDQISNYLNNKVFYYLDQFVNETFFFTILNNNLLYELGLCLVSRLKQQLLILEV